MHHCNRWLADYCIQFNISAHSTRRSIIEIKTISYKRIATIQEVVTVEDGYQDIPLYGGLSRDVITKGGAVIIMNEEEGLLSVMIHPVGQNENGHSVNCCFE